MKVLFLSLPPPPIPISCQVFSLPHFGSSTTQCGNHHFWFLDFWDNFYYILFNLHWILFRCSFLIQNWVYGQCYCLLAGVRLSQHTHEHMISYMPTVYSACTWTSKLSYFYLVYWKNCGYNKTSLSQHLPT